MADIMPMAVKMIASAEGLQQGVEKTKAIIGKGAADLSKQAENLGRTMGTKLTGAFKLAMGAGAAAAGGGALVAGGMAYAYYEGANMIREMGNAAAQASAPVEEFQALVAAFGKSEDAIDAATKLANLVGKAAVLGEGADALNAIGLDATQLANSTNAFEQVADKIGAMGQGFRQSWAAMSLFGEDYKKFMPVLSRGGEFIREQKALLDSFGATIGGSAVANVRDADRFFAQFDALKQGFFVQIASGVAPMIAELSALIPKLSEMGITFKGMAGFIVDSAEAVSKLGYATMEAFSSPQVRSAMFEIVGDVMVYAANKFTQALTAGLAAMMQTIGNRSLGKLWIPGMGEMPLGRLPFGDIGDDLARKSQNQGIVAATRIQAAAIEWKQLQESLRDLPGFAALEGFFGRVRNRMADVGNAAMRNNPFEVWKVSVDALEQSVATSTDQMVKEFNRLESLVRNAPTINDLLSPKGSFARNPMDEFQNAFQQTIDDAENMREKLLEPVFRKLGGMAAQIGQMNQYQPVGAMEQGSREAFSTVTAARFSARESMEQMIARLLAENNKLAAEQARAGRDLVEAWRKAQPVRVGGM